VVLLGGGKGKGRSLPSPSSQMGDDSILGGSPSSFVFSSCLEVRASCPNIKVGMKVGNMMVVVVVIKVWSEIYPFVAGPKPQRYFS